MSNRIRKLLEYDRNKIEATLNSIKRANMSHREASI